MAQSPGESAASSGGTDSGTLITEQVKQGTQQVVDQSQQVAGQVAQTAQQKAESMLSSRKDSMAESLNSVAQALRDTGNTLRNQNQGSVAGVADTAADRIENVAGYFQQRDIGQVVSEAENYARRNPAIVLGGAFILGVAAARFLKSSSPPQQPSGYSGDYRDYSRYSRYGGYDAGLQHTPSLGFGSGYEDTTTYSGVSETYPPESVGSLRGAGLGTTGTMTDEILTPEDRLDEGADDVTTGGPY